MNAACGEMGSEASGNFGAKLRGARERKGVSLRTIAARTKISIGVLEALERNDIGRLPGGIFSRAFVRSYANEVGLDPETTIQEFMAQFPQESVTAGHPRSDQVEDTEMFESDRRVASSLLWMLLVSVPLAVGVLYLSLPDKFGRAQPPAGPPPGKATAAAPAPSGAVAGLPELAQQGPLGPAAQAAVPPASGPGRASARPPEAAAETGRPSREPSPATPPTSRVSVTPSTPGTSAAGSASSAEASPAPSGRPTPAPAASAPEGGATATPEAGDKLTIVLSARRPVWVSATVDGQKVLGRLLQTGDQHTVEVKRELVVTAGDAAAMRMTLNGAEARALGKTGEVVTARVTLANFKEYLQTR